MFPKLVLCLVASISAAGAQNFSLLRDASWPYDNITPFCYRTCSPANFESKSARLVILPTPLKITVALNEEHCITNTGNSVTVTVPRNSFTSITGGVLASSVYIFQQLTYYWSDDYLTPAASGIDGEVTPLFVQIVFRNAKYPNCATANKFRDGYAIIQINIKVEGCAPNPAFIPFENLLRSVTNAGSTVHSSSLPLFLWFDQLTWDRYYSYPGSYSESFGFIRTEYDSATIIQAPKAFTAFISVHQFKCFTKLRNHVGSPFCNRLVAHPAGSRPIVEVCGIRQIFVPTAA